MMPYIVNIRGNSFRMRRPGATLPPQGPECAIFAGLSLPTASCEGHHLFEDRADLGSYARFATSHHGKSLSTMSHNLLLQPHLDLSRMDIL